MVFSLNDRAPGRATLPVSWLGAAFAVLWWISPAAAFTTAEAKVPMTVTLVRSDAAGCGADCPEWLALTGKIGFETPRVLSAALAGLKGRKVPILLDSPGGESRAGVAMGRQIRDHKLDTVVGGTVLSSCGVGDAACASLQRSGVHPGHIAGATPACASACVLVLAGGTDRVVPFGTYVGVHQALQILTFHPVMNTFHILRRMVGGRPVEVSRTLVATRAMPVRVVKGAAPPSLYSELDRHLLGMGIAEAIMPLMRSTPPSGIHWLTRDELTATRMATETTDAAAFVEQAATSRATAEAAAAARRTAQATAAALRPIGVPAALTLDDDRRWPGTITWRIDATSREVPVLIGEWRLPERHIGGTVEIVPETASPAAGSFTVSARFTSDVTPGAATVLSIRPPQICDLSLCWSETSEDAPQDRSAASFHVVRDWRGDFLKQLHKRDWLVFGVRTEDGWGKVAFTLSSLDDRAIDLWETLCCSFASTGDPWTAPATPLPDRPEPRGPFLVAGFGPVAHVAGGIATTAHHVGVKALFDPASPPQSGGPTSVGGSMTWTPLAGLGAPGRLGEAFLVGDADLPAAHLHLKVKVSLSEAGILGRLTLGIHATAEDEAVFGPPDGFTFMTIYDRERHPLLLADSVFRERWEGGYGVAFDIPETGPIAGAIQLAFEDARHRRVTVALPLDPAMAALLQAAARGRDPAPSPAPLTPARVSPRA